MADMVEVVIKIPKEKYDSICSMCEAFPAEMKERGLEYIKNGTVLSKGHGDLVDRTITVKITLTPREIAEEIWNFNPVEQADLILALTQKFYDKENHGLKRLYDLKEGLKELNEDKRRDAIMFLKGVRETLKDTDRELKYE